MTQEWQPARLLSRVHPLLDSFMGRLPFSKEQCEEQSKKIYHIRLWESPDSIVVAHYRARGCDSKRFFLIKEIHNAACEHEVVTD